MFEFTVAADVGSGHTRLAARSGIRTEETRAALDPVNGNRVLAFGTKAGKLLNVNSVFPVRGGISDVRLTALMLRRFTLDMLKRRSLFGVSLRIAVPFSCSPLEHEAALDAGREAGFTAVRVFDSMIAGAHGAGVDIDDTRASMTVDIGRERMNMLIAASGGAVLERTAEFGSSVFDRHIQAYFAMEQNMLLSFRAAESIKMSLDKPVVRVHGRDSLTGQPLMRAVSPHELREALRPTAALLAGEIVRTIEKAPPEAAADLLDNGITLIGGGAEQYGLSKTLEEMIGVSVRTAQNAENAVILGMQQTIFGSPGLRTAARR
jgi:rod shape-determining protein MreB